ncbi:N-6 DNA methylase [candidate division TA06 bacterium]|uniref:site-specific DNA-methyltransferase (adenine-specific) n=1 Tax=candidate division TA06 bacterium TaxID=2250710 RepID=A0A933I9S3_UNCT6|nr:N-6 DNA methylase [candidate division TA06 bacterium]
MKHFGKAHKAVCHLVKDFQAHEKTYLSLAYQEAEVRKDFIDKFFIALGWDVNHEQQKNPYEQEVKVEKGVIVARAQKRADYAFCLAPNFRDAKFFVEAKKPAKSLFNPDDYFQTARYGWNANTPIAVLTDFEEFHIIDCRFKPNINTALTQKLTKYHYSEYADQEKFAKIYYLFSHEAVEGNSLEKHAETLKKPTGKAVQRGLFPGGYQPIDEAFLEEIDEIRKTLAKAFKKNCPEMMSNELTEAVQRTVDRLVFIRFLEDKLMEAENYLDNIGTSGQAWAEFIALCRKLDKKYNGVVFKETSIDLAGFEGPVDSEFRDICKRLSRQNSPYDFNFIPIHILGSIYERFLGKEVHATAKRVDIEEKPEVRKAGGVYYTPQYIVRYIVENTIGKLIEGKTPEEIAKLRFADIACGSGSFLIWALELLLDYHHKYYQAHPEKAKKDGCYQKDGKWVLNIRQKQSILLNNIYGVDIDPQAIEVTQLSLALKMLEDETTATANDMQVLFHSAVLPDLTKNIVCGNSLIGINVLQEDLFTITNQNEPHIKPMDYESVFPKVMDDGGFDAVIGNPPYINVENLDGITREILMATYRTAIKRFDIYIAFMEKGLDLLKVNGLLSFIIPYPFISQNYAELLRTLLVDHCKIKTIVDLSNVKIFNEAVVKNCIVIIENIEDKKI